jgi:F-type H+-transporting ATPase subunit b
MEVNSTLLIQLAIFLSLLGILSRSLFTPMLKLFEERERRIQGAQAEAAELHKQAQAKLEETERRIHAAQREAKQVLFDLQAEGARFHREILDKAREEAQKRMQEASWELAAQVSGLRQELSGEQGPLSQLLVGKFLSSPSNSKAHMEHSHA